MDEIMADALASGAQTIVRLMSSDLWNTLRASVVRIFGEKQHEALTEDLEASRTRIVASRPNSIATAQSEELDRWEARLRLRLLDDPDALHLVRELLDEARAAGITVNTNSGTANISAYARDNARVYQQGYGTQQNS